MEITWRLSLAPMLIVGGLTGCGGGGGGDDGFSAAGGDVTDSPTQLTELVAPIVIATSPAHNSVGVEPNRNITATFSEAIDPATLNPQTYFLADDVTRETVSGVITYDESSKTAIFHTGDLSSASAYTVTLTAGVRDLAGNPMEASYSWRFSTGASLDDMPPAVVSTFPARNALNVSLQSTLVATFSEAIDPSTINPQTFTLKKGGISKVTGTVSYTGTSALFEPTQDLEADASYTATVSADIKDLAGNALTGGDFTWTFTTGTQPDTVAPWVLEVSPRDGEQNVLRDSPFVVVFNEPIRPFEFGNIDGRPVRVIFNATYTTISLQPTVGLDAGLRYIAAVVASDMAGNQMSEKFIWAFTTGP